MKSKGGRGKTVGYKTVTMRIPQPIQAEVERLRENFYATYTSPNPIHKDVTGISRIEDLGFSRELTNKLQRNQIKSVEDLQKLHTAGELKSLRNVGRVSLQQIEEKLAWFKS